MKRILFSIFILSSLAVSAKKVKFSVNMELVAVDSNGAHITGDFQGEAGYPNGDWDPGTTGMTQEVGDTNIYSVVVDIPAFRVYEFKFVNGIFGYQQEFVPVESRVNYNFIDNRWIYIDSLSNDTQMVAEIRYGGNAPAGMNLVRLYVDMQLQSVSGNGVHVAGSFQSWNVSSTRMASFDGLVYEYLAYVDSGANTEREYKFLNGNTSTDYEALPGWCVNGNGNRAVVAPRDSMLPVVCYTFCDACSTVGIDEQQNSGFDMMPNPAHDDVTLVVAGGESWSLSIVDITGREMVRSNEISATSLQVETSTYPAGLYFVRIMNSHGQTTIKKLVIE